MIYMGDEYGHTKGGNNNTYCHDSYVIPLRLADLCASIKSIYLLFTDFQLCCSLITFSGIRGKSLHQTFSDFAAS